MSQRKTILIVEDDLAIRAMMTHILELEGYQTVVASDGNEGIRMLQRSPRPAVILLDMMMPVTNGWDFLDFARTNAETARIPIIVVSAYAEIARSVRPQAFVPKPIHLKSLLSAIEAFAA